MKNKIPRTKTFVFLFIFLFFSFNILNPSIYQVRGEEYYFENVNVVIIGRCRAIDSDGSWLGGLYKGWMHHFGVTAWHTPLERIRVIVYNESIIHPWMTFYRLRNSTGGNQVNGTFFWDSEDDSASLFPPIVFVHCYAERFQVNV
jgi:hypothetical protein